MQKNLKKRLEKKIGNFGKNSAIDKKLYTRNKKGNFIRLKELDFESTNNFQFDEKQSYSIYKFVFNDSNNTNELVDYIKDVIKKRT